MVYTTRIIYTLNIPCYDNHVIKKKRNALSSGKEKDMTTMNRLYCLYSESCLSAYLEESEMGLCFMHSSIDKQKTRKLCLDTDGNC